MKKIFLGLMMLTCIFTLVGCFGGKEKLPEGFTELVIWGGDEYNGETEENLQKWLDYFNATPEMQELKVKLRFRSMTSLPISLNTGAITNNVPEIVIWDRFSTPSYSYLLQPLDEMIARDQIDSKEFNQVAYKELSFEGHQYGLPLDLDPWGIFVNLNIVDEYNKNADEASKVDVNKLTTWSEVLDAAKKLTITDKKGKVTTAGLNTTSMDGNFFSFVYSGASKIINDDPTTETYGDTTLVPTDSLMQDPISKRVYDTLAYFKTLYEEKVCDNALGGTNAFINNKLAMTFGSVYFPQKIADLTGKDVPMKFIPFPRRDMDYRGTKYTIVDPEAEAQGLINGQYGGVLGGYGLSIPMPDEKFRDEEWQRKRDLSWEVIKLWIMNDELNREYFKTTKQITSRLSLHDDPFYQEEGVIKDILPYLDFYNARPNVEGYEQFETNVVRTEIQRMYEGSTALTIYGNIRKNGNTLLRQIQGRD